MKRLDQSGSISILVIAFVVMGMLLMYGILAVTESLVAKKQVQYATQASANAGAYMYGRAYLKELNSCIKEKILEENEGENSEISENHDEPSETDSSVSVCLPSELRECAESDFEECAVDLTTCWEEAESPINACQEDRTVREAALDAAKDSARDIASRNHLEHFTFSLQNDLAEVSAERTLETRVPHFGVSRNFAGRASSKVIISDLQEEE
jgi:hypothetical protein